jgi:hypothetical protein
MIKLDAGVDNDIYADSRFKFNVNYIRLVQNAIHKSNNA